MSHLEDNRRPIKTRTARWARNIAQFLADKSISPNEISILSIVSAMLGAGSLLFYPGPLGMLLCTVFIQIRLLCNMLDGMVAVEYGKQTPTGHLYNEFPDRIADVVLIVALGYVIGVPWLGWLGAVLAVSTAYIRAVGGALGLAQDYCGPMAKPHRMALMTAACVIASVEYVLHETVFALTIAAIVMVVGSAWTCVRRARRIAALLRATQS